MPIKSLPSRPSLELDKKQAKRLLRAAREGDATALARIAAQHPRYASAAAVDVGALRLADVELVLAREYGFASWPRYKHFVEALLADRSDRVAMLTRAVCSNQLARGVALLEREPELARSDFFAACACGELEHVRAALAKDAALAVTGGGPNGWPPLVYVCFSRFWRRDRARAAQLLEIARLLLEHGASPDSHYVTEEHGQVQTCLFAAAGIANHPELTRLLLEAGASVDESVEPPPAAAVEARPEHIEAWLKQHPLEALYHACEFRDVACLRLLLEAKPIALAVSYCLGRALDFESDAARLFLEHGADPNFVVPWAERRAHFHKAVMHRRSPALLRAMLEHGADPNLPDAAGATPYDYAVRHGADELAFVLAEFGGQSQRAHANATPDPYLLVREARRGNVTELARYLALGANVNAALDMPPLHSACYAGQLPAAKLLVEHGASLSQLNAYRGTALASCIYGSVDCCDEQGGPGTLLPEEVPARDYAELTEWLIARGAELPSSIGSGSDAVQEVLRRHGVPDPAP